MTEKRHPRLAQVLSRPFKFVRGKCFGIVSEHVDDPIQLTEENKLLATNQLKESKIRVTQI